MECDAKVDETEMWSNRGEKIQVKNQKIIICERFVTLFNAPIDQMVDSVQKVKLAELLKDCE